MMAEPMAKAVTSPVSLTITLEASAVVHRTDLSTAVSGSTVTVRVCLSPFSNASEEGVTDTDSTEVSTESSSSLQAVKHVEAASIIKKNFFIFSKVLMVNYQLP
jgi:hypothetical protein